MLNNSNGFKEFLKAALRDPKKVSTIFPTLRFLAQSLIENAEMKTGDHVLELGCGTGAITREILDHNSQPGSYLGVEIDGELVKYLQQNFNDQKFIQASADDLKDSITDGSIDVVICSIPWTMLPQETQEAITQEILRVLKPGGRFTTFICVHALSYPGATRVKKIFKSHFTSFKKKDTIARNIPPANVYLGRK